MKFILNKSVDLELADPYDDNCPDCWKNFITYIGYGTGMNKSFDPVTMFADEGIVTFGRVSPGQDVRYVTFDSPESLMKFKLKWS